MVRPFDWSGAVCNTPVLLQLIPGLTPSMLDQRRERGLARRGPGYGPSKLFLADEIAELAFCGSLLRLGFSTTEADSVWQTAGRLVLQRRTAPQPGQVTGVCLAIWRQANGSIGISAYRTACGSELEPAVVPNIGEAQLAGRPIISMEIDNLFDAVERAIRERCPGSAAVMAGRRVESVG